MGAKGEGEGEGEGPQSPHLVALRLEVLREDAREDPFGAAAEAKVEAIAAPTPAEHASANATAPGVAGAAVSARARPCDGRCDDGAGSVAAPTRRIADGDRRTARCAHHRRAGVRCHLSTLHLDTSRRSGTTDRRDHRGHVGGGCSGDDVDDTRRGSQGATCCAQGTADRLSVKAARSERFGRRGGVMLRAQRGGGPGAGGSDQGGSACSRRAAIRGAAAGCAARSCSRVGGVRRPGLSSCHAPAR